MEGVYIDRVVESGTHDPEPIFEMCRFIGNTALTGGGAVYVETTAEVIFVQCVFEQNEVSSGSGGAVRFTHEAFGGSRQIDFLSCSFVGNRASSQAGALFIGQESGSLNLRNCFFGGNRAVNGSGGAVFLALEGISISQNFLEKYSVSFKVMYKQKEKKKKS